MIAIIENGKIHSIYEDLQADKIFKIRPLSDIEYTSTSIELMTAMPERSAEQIASDNEKMRGLAYAALTDKLYVKAYRKNDETVRAEADAIVAQIKKRWPETI